MSEEGPTIDHQSSGENFPSNKAIHVTKRNSILVGSVVLLSCLFALLGWAIATSDGIPSGLGINNRAGEITISQRQAPDFKIDSLDGQSISLEQLRGNIVMVYFWSSWCPPCRTEARSLNEVYAAYQNRGIIFIGIAIWDHPESVENFYKDFSIAFPSGLDTRGQIAVDYGVTGIPEKYFLDQDGNLIRKFIGPLDSQHLSDVLEDMLHR